MGFVFWLLYYTTLAETSRILLHRDMAGRVGFRSIFPRSGDSADGVGGHEVFVQISFTSVNRIPAEIQSSLLQSNSSNVSILLLDNFQALVFPKTMVADSLNTVVPNYWNWGILPNGPVAHQLGPITILQHSLQNGDNNNFEAEFYVESSFDFFSSHCFENSIINLTSLDQNHVSFSLLGSGFEPTNITRGFSLRVSDLERSDIMVVPIRVRDAVVTVLTNSGAYQVVRDSNMFFNCSEELVADNLPRIILHLESGAQLSIDRDDYINFYNALGFCEIALGSAAADLTTIP